MVLLVLTTSPANGQWITQTIPLQSGWNAVFLEVQPEPDNCEVVFQGLPVESVWFWNRRFSSVQFIQDASTLMPEQPEWLTFFPSASGKGHLSDLFIIQGGRAYLVKVSGSQSVEWVVKGKPAVRPMEWMAESFNLVGFRVDPSAPPTFQTFFASSTAHAGQPVYKLNAMGHWQNIINPSVEKMEAGRAYWVYCDGQSSYSGPVQVSLEQGDALDFGRVLTEQTLRIRNETSATKQITLTTQASETPPATEPPLAGEVLLAYWNWGIGVPGWLDLPGQLPMNIEPGKELALRLAVRRKDMPGGSGALYQSLLSVIDGEGSRLLVPVIAKGMVYNDAMATDLSAGSRAPEEGGTSTHARAGLWVGTAIVNKVSFPADPDPAKRLIPLPAASEFQMRLIVHVDAGGEARLLQKVTLMWKEGVTDAAGVVVEPGRYVLLATDEASVVSQFSGAALRDGKQIGRRISSAAFAFSDPLPMTGDFDATLTCNGITLGYDDPLNPFQHQYHPDHDNLDFDFQTPVPEGKESYTFVRNLELEFTSGDPDGLSLAGWGDNQVGGIYRESIQGVHKEVLQVEGSFRLHHVSRIPVLDDGM